MKFNSVKFKISIFYAIVLGLLLTSYSFFLYHSLYQALKDDLDEDLKEKSRLVQIFINEFYEQKESSIKDSDKRLVAAIDMTVNMSQLKDRTYVYINADKEWLKLFDYLDLSRDFLLFLDMDGRTIIQTDNVGTELESVFLSELEKGNLEEEYFKNIPWQTDILRLMQMPFYFNGEFKFVLLIATSEKTMLDLLGERKYLLLWSIPVVLVSAIVIGMIFAGRLVAPILEVAHVAERISYKDLTQRVSSEYSDEEIHTLVNAFNKMIDRLERSFSHIMNFNSHVAHELKTPIAIMRGECEVALRREQSSEEYRESLRTVLEESRRMLKIVEDLLLLARLSYSGKIFSNEEFGLKDFFEELCLRQQQLALEQGVRLTFSLPEEPIRLKGDPVHLQRLFVNIINNAVKFTPKGGNVDVNVSVSDENLVVTISDTGIGISSTDIDKIFDQFYHKRPVELPNVHGTGLGLSIARSIAQAHGGRIEAASVLNKGSIFTVFLPLVISSVGQNSA